MKTLLGAIVLCCSISTAALAQQQGFQDVLLDRMVGKWVLTGTIAGTEATHDVEAGWVLGHQYMRFHEVSRERTEDGGPAYEAIVFIGWDEPSSRYACLWLDLTGGGGLSAGAIGHAKPSGDDIPFVFDDGTGGAIHNTFRYNRDADSWSWLIDNERDGKRTPFARVSLSRE
jgi:hypothetical protein